jgi:hypothetical protein
MLAADDSQVSVCCWRNVGKPGRRTSGDAEAAWGTAMKTARTAKAATSRGARRHGEVMSRS